MTQKDFSGVAKFEGLFNPREPENGAIEHGSMGALSAI